MPGIARNHEQGPACDFFSSTPRVEVSHESLGRAADVVEIHRVGSDTGKFRRLVLARVASFCLGDDFANRAAAQTTGPKSKGAEEAVVEFRPFIGAREFRNGGEIKGRIRG